MYRLALLLPFLLLMGCSKSEEGQARREPGSTSLITGPTRCVCYVIDGQPGACC